MSMSPSLDFNFYVKCAKPLILALTSLQDRSLASAWIKRLAEDKTVSDELRNNYLKLLIYFLQKRELDGPFLEHPSSYDVLSDFPEGQNLFQTSEVFRKKRKQAYSLDFSGDLRTYVACQDIKNAGVHCYYAFSKYPVSEWQGFDPDLFPAGAEAAKVAPKAEESEEKKVTKENRKVVFDVPSIGKRAPSDDRIPPSWGSNLLLDLEHVTQDKQ